LFCPFLHFISHSSLSYSVFALIYSSSTFFFICPYLFLPSLFLLFSFFVFSSLLFSTYFFFLLLSSTIISLLFLRLIFCFSLQWPDFGNRVSGYERVKWIEVQ
jgi:hypothetical protein